MKAFISRFDSLQKSYDRCFLRLADTGSPTLAEALGKAIWRAAMLMTIGQRQRWAKLIFRNKGKVGMENLSVVEPVVACQEFWLHFGDETDCVS